MFTINAYSVHPLVSRFLNVWRYAEVVTDWLTSALSCLCCQCLGMACDAPSASVSSKTSVETSQVLVVDSERVSGEPFRPQHLVIDFHRQAGDNESVTQKCSDFWSFVRSQPALDGMLVTPDGNNKTAAKELPTQHKPKNAVELNDYPAVHMLKNMDQFGHSIEAFAASQQTP